MLGGLPTIYGINPFATETVPQHQLGAIGVTPDGRKFRYAYVGAVALVAGDVVQTPAEVTGNQSRIVAAAAIGATSITTTDTVTTTANQFTDGYIIVTGEASTGTGHTYRIKSHDVVSAAVATFQLYDPIEVALTATTQVDIVANPYRGVIQWPATQTGSAIGVAFVAAPLNTYTWIQTGGLAGVLTTGTVAVGANVAASTASAAAVETATAAMPTLGYAVTGVATGEVGAIYLIID